MMQRLLAATALALAALVPVATAAGQNCTGSMQLNLCGSTEVFASSAISGRTVVVVTAVSATVVAAIRASRNQRRWQPVSEATPLPGSTVVLVPESQFQRTHRPGQSNGNGNANGSSQTTTAGQGNSGQGESSSHQETSSQSNTSSSSNTSNQGTSSSQGSSSDHGTSSNQENNSAQHQGSNDGNNASDGHGSDGNSDAEDGHGSDGNGDAETGHDDDENDDHDVCREHSSLISATTLSHGSDGAEHHDADHEDDDDDCGATTTTPEPAGLALLGTGMLGLVGAYQWRRRRSGTD